MINPYFRPSFAHAVCISKDVLVTAISPLATHSFSPWISCPSASCLSCMLRALGPFQLSASLVIYFQCLQCLTSLSFQTLGSTWFKGYD